MASDVIDIDKGWKALVGKLNQLGGGLRIGVMGDDGYYERGGDKPATVVDIATFNEFGTVDIPARPFLRSTFDEKNKAWTQFTQRLLNLMPAGTTPEMILDLLGQKAVADVQQKIVDLREPPNAPSTIAQKGSSNPLIDTGRLRQSVSYEVEGRKR